MICAQRGHREGPTTAPRGRRGEDIQTPAHVDGALSLPRLKSNDKDTERRGDKHKTWKGQRAGCDRQARFLEPVGLRQKAQCGPRGCGGPLPARARVSCHGPPGQRPQCPQGPDFTSFILVFELDDFERFDSHVPIQREKARFRLWVLLLWSGC